MRAAIKRYFHTPKGKAALARAQATYLAKMTPEERERRRLENVIRMRAYRGALKRALANR